MRVGGTFGAPPEAAVKNSDTLWRFSKKFKFLKEVKFLSEFFRNKLVCLMPIYVRGRRPPKCSACQVEAKKFGLEDCGMKFLVL